MMFCMFLHLFSRRDDVAIYRSLLRFLRLRLQQELESHMALHCLARRATSTTSTSTSEIDPNSKLVKSTPIDFGIPRSREKKRQYMSNTCQYSLVLCSAVNVTQRTRLESSASNMLVCRIPFSKTSGACGLSISCKPNLSPAV